MTGGSGWIGQAVCREVESRGWKPDVFDRRTGGDVLDTAHVRSAVAECDAVINLAGVLGTTELFADVDTAVRVNIAGAVHVYRAAAQVDVPVVQIGTGHKGQMNPYAITKACAEDLALAMHGQGQPIAVVRAYHAYGPGQTPPHPWGPPGAVVKAIPAWIMAGLTNRPLQVFGTGHQQIDLVHVTDVARALVEPLAHLDEPAWGGAFPDAGTGVGTTVRDAAHDVARASSSGAWSILTDLVARPGEPLDAVVVAERPAEVVEHEWPYGLDETVAYYRERYL